jgi:translation initiation factor 4E binding protein 2
MSASPIARQAHTHAQLIPAMRKVLISEPSQMPDVYSSTPNGTLYSTTPGGTKIVYERTFLMNLKNSPLSRTPPKNIPCHLLKDDKTNFHQHNHQNLKNGSYQPPKNNHHHHHKKNEDKSNGWNSVRRPSEDHQFDMDM